MLKKYLLISVLAVGGITTLHHDSLDGFVANEHIDHTGTTLNFNNISMSGYFDLANITEPSDPSANTLRLYTEDIQGFSFFKYLDSGGMKREVLRDSMILVYNNTGSTIVANRVVYATGSFNNFPTVGLAKSNSAAKMPAIGVTIESISNSAYGRVMQVGLLENIDTSSLSVGDILYVHDTVAGLVRITPPTTPALTQEIGTVLVDNATTGAIQIIARGVTGDEYGTAQNSFLIGDGTAGSKTLTFNATTDGSIIWDETKFDFGTHTLTAAGATITGCTVLGLNSAVFQPTADSATFFQVLDADGGTPIFNIDTTNERVGIGTTGPSGKFSVGSAAGEDAYFFYDNDDVGDTANGQSLYLYRRAAEGDDYIRFYVDKWGTSFVKSSGVLTFDAASGSMDFYTSAGGNARWFSGSAEGETREAQIFGYRTGDAKRLLAIGVGVDAADTASFDGLSNYYFSGNVGIGETAPETLTEWTAAAPYLTLHNSTHEDTDGGGESRFIFKREDGAGTETACFQFEASHDGTGANDQLGKGVWSVNTGAGLAEGLRINSNADVDVANDLTAGTIQADNGVSGTLVLDDGATERITLVFTGGVLTSRTVAATVASLIDWTD